MSDTAIGFILAFFGSLSFGTYILPRKLSKLPVLEYQYWLALAIAPVCVGTAIVAGSELLIQARLALIALSCGPLWTLGSLCYSSAVDNIGVARSTPIKNMAPVFAAVYGILIFHEFTIRDPVPLALTIGGVLLMTGAAVVIGRASALEHETAYAFTINRSEAERSRSFWLGALFSLGAAFFYGAYSIPLKYVLRNGVSPYTACAWLGVGVLVSSFIAYMIFRSRWAPKFPGWRQFRIAQLGGLIWSVGQITGSVAMIYIAMAISWPVTNLSTLIAVAWGVWIFKEIHLERHVREIIMSLSFYTIGLVLLALAASEGRV